MIKFLLLTCLLLAQVVAFAQTCTATGWRPWRGTEVYPSATAACQASAPKYDAVAHENGANVGATYTFERSEPNGDCFIRYTPATGTGNVFLLYNSYGPVSGSCPGPAPSPDEACIPKKGVTSIVNRTVGFVRSSAENDFSVVGPVTKSVTGSLICTAGCAAELQPVTSSTAGAAAYRSAMPNAQGLYRLSLDLPVTNTGRACSATAEGSATEKAAQNPLTPSPLCPGYVGEVNGVKGCYGTAEKPVTTVPADRPAVPPVNGNPAAGEKPVSGEGSGTGGTGRTPSTGTGDNNGGPSGAAGRAAGAPTGTASAPAAGEEQAACGAPGQPRCRIDESGTPSDWKPDELKSHADKYKADVEAARGTVSGSADKNFFSGWSSAFFAPPIAECVPFQLPRDMGSIDPCPVAAGMRSVMGWIWAVGGLLLCLRMIKKVV